MKLRDFFLIVALISMTSAAYPFDIDKDLRDAKLLARGYCDYTGPPTQCLFVKKDDTFYLIGFDQKGILYVVNVKELKGEYDEKDLKLVWKRPSKNDT